MPARGIGQKTRVVEPLPKPRPELVAPVASTPSLYLYRDVLDEIRFNGAWRPDRVAGGLLVGEHYQDPETGVPFVEVEGFVAGAHCADTPDFIRHLRLQWKSSAATQRYHFPDSEVVGWFVARQAAEAPPGQAELVLHNTFFGHAWQTGLWIVGDAEATALQPRGDTFLTSPVGLMRGGRAR